MALKLTVREQCPQCGGRAARKIGNAVVRFGHNDCPKAPPGPSAAPQRFRADEVDFVPGDFDAAALRAELDEAWQTIEGLRQKRWTAEARAIAAVREAMASTFSANGEFTRNEEGQDGLGSSRAVP